MAMVQREFDCAVGVVHHSGYDPTHARGSSANLGNFDTQFMVTRPGNKMMAVVKMVKQKDGERVAP